MMKNELALANLTEEDLTGIATRMAVHSSLPLLIYLQGELGSGKTTFVREWLRTLGVTGHIRSPSFTLIESYQTVKGTFHHLDLYRLIDPQELEFLGFRDYLLEGCLIEWPTNAENYLPNPDLLISLSYSQCGTETREFKMQAFTTKGKHLIEACK